MIKAECFCVECKHCKKPIPLIEFDAAYHYTWEDSYAVVHSEQDPASSCIGTAIYDSSDQLNRQVRDPIAGFVPHRAFAASKFSRIKW
jgi:hypothetical protein